MAGWRDRLADLVRKVGDLVRDAASPSPEPVPVPVPVPVSSRSRRRVLDS